MSTSMVTQGSLVNTTSPQNGGGMAATAVGSDNVTNHLAGMSKHQLYQIVSQMKDLIHQNQQQARQILIANPQLTKTLFQAQIMLGMVRAPETLPPASTPAQPPEQPLAQPQAPQIQPTLAPPLVTLVQPLPNQQQSVQQSVQPHQQTASLTNTVLPPSQVLPPSSLQPPLQHAPTQPPLPSHPPPLPQQPRPLGPPSQMQQQITQGIAFPSQPAPQSYHPQPPYMQQGGPPQTNAGSPYQQMLAPPLPSQPLPQHMFQVPRSRNDMSGGANIGSGGILPMEGGRGLSMGVPSTSAPLMTWNQTLPTSAPMGVPQVTPAGVAGHMVPGHHAFVGGSGLSSSLMPGPGSSQVFNPPLAQPQPPQLLQHQPQGQMPIELEQQKALLQQVMNLTPEQINLLPPEQRQQVLQLQQAFRSQSG